MSLPKWHLPTVPSPQSSFYYEEGMYSESDASKAATMLAVRLVGQVLEEACTVVSATQRIGWPWTSVLSMFKDLKTGQVTVPERDALFEYLQGDNEAINEKTDRDNAVATSTPHKDECTKPKPENSLIGQGDAEIDIMIENELKCINQLFDMTAVSDVDKDEVEIDNNEYIITNDYKLSDMSDILEKIFQSVVATTTETQANVFEIPAQEKNEVAITEITIKDEVEITEITIKDEVEITEVTIKDEVEITEIEEEDMKEKIREIQYAFIQEAYDTCGLETVKCFVDNDDEESMDEQFTHYATVDVHEGGEYELAEPVIQVKSNENEKEEICEAVHSENAYEKEKCEVARYEDAYLTLNRDYDDDEDAVLQDPKQPMQEVELFPSSEDSNSSVCQEEEGRKKLAAISGISGASGSRKSRTSLMSRCKTQGARLLSCLRGWWRRKTPGKRREARRQGSVRGVCPLSPDARRRAASMLDQRNLYSPSASRSGAWKFNTVNEGIIQSTRWKDYTYELAEKSSDEF